MLTHSNLENAPIILVHVKEVKDKPYMRVFFMGHKRGIESRYATNKGRLPDALVNEMREAFGRSEEYPDQTSTDPSQEQRMKLQQIIEDATPENLGNMLEVLQTLAN